MKTGKEIVKGDTKCWSEDLYSSGFAISIERRF
jgi:hypothetical protein